MRDRRPGPVTRTRVTEFVGDRERQHEDRLVTEEPLEIRLAWPGRPAERVWVTMRTPGNDFELVAGWIAHEGLGTVSRIAYCTDVDLAPDQEFNVVTATLEQAPSEVPHQHESVTAGSSACGVCGRDSVQAAMPDPDLAWSGPAPHPDVVRRLPDALRQRQRIFDHTGGVLAAGLADAQGALLVVREDVVVAAYHLRREVRQRARGDGVEDARGPPVAVVLLEGAARPRGLGDVGDDDAEGQRQREDEADAPDL